MHFVVFAGEMGSGKDTAARVLIENHGYTKLALADPLKELCSSLLEFPTHFCYNREGKAYRPAILDNKMTVGRALQILGTEVGRQFSPDIWCHKLVNRAESMGLEKIVITDCRFLNEAQFFIQHFGDSQLIVLKRKAKDEHIAGRDGKHDSERGVERIREWVRDAGAQPRYSSRVSCLDNSSISVERLRVLVMDLLEIPYYRGE